MAVTAYGKFLLLGLAGGWLAACSMGGAGGDTGGDQVALSETGQPMLDATVNAPTSIKLVDRDVEAPEVFQTEGEALWDGRPSLGGVWVASPDATDPQRVIMRNPANGKFVIGALFRRERDNPGPALQISSDAADALGLLAGEPARISVTALRREEAPAPETDASAPILDTAETVAGEALPPATDVTATAAQAIDKAEAKDTPAAEQPPTAQADTGVDTGAPAAATPPPAKPAAVTGSLIQIGFFSVEANAQRAVDQLKKAGILATIRKSETQGKVYWSVTARGDKAMLDAIRAAGFADAYVIQK